MGGLQRGRAGGCSVMRRPQVAAEFKESTFNFNFNLTFAEDSSFSPQLEGDCNAQFSGKSS